MSIHPFYAREIKPNQTANGYDIMGSTLKGYYAPKTHAEDLLTKMLHNKIQGVNAKYAESKTQADLLRMNLANQFSSDSMADRLQALSLGNESRGLSNQYSRESMADRLLSNQLTNQNTGFDVAKKRTLQGLNDEDPYMALGGDYTQMTAMLSKLKELQEEGQQQQPEYANRLGQNLQQQQPNTIEEPLNYVQVGEEQSATPEEIQQIKAQQIQQSVPQVNKNQEQISMLQHMINKKTGMSVEQSTQLEKVENYVNKIERDEGVNSDAAKRAREYRDSLIKSKLGLGRQTQLKTAIQERQSIVDKNGINHPLVKKYDEYIDKLKGFKGQSPEEIEQKKIVLEEKLQRRKQDFQKNEDLKEYRTKKMNQDSWYKRSVDDKADAIAQAQGAGVTSDEANRWFNNGGSLENLMAEKGYTKDGSDWPEKIHQLTSKNRSTFNERRISAKEADFINNYISSKLGKSGSTVMGYNIKDGWNALTGSNDNERIDFLSARALAPELAGLRLSMANAKSTVHAIKNLTDKSMLELKTWGVSIPGPLLEKVQKRITGVLQDALEHAQSRYGSAATKEDVQKHKEKTKFDTHYKSYEDVAKGKGAKDYATKEQIEAYSKKNNISKEETINRLRKAYE